MSVVGDAQESAVADVGDTAGVHGVDVVDVAILGGFVASGGMLTAPVPHLDRGTHRPGEEPAETRGPGRGLGLPLAAESDDLHGAVVQVGGQVARAGTTHPTHAGPRTSQRPTGAEAATPSVASTAGPPHASRRQSATPATHRTPAGPTPTRTTQDATGHRPARLAPPGCVPPWASGPVTGAFLRRPVQTRRDRRAVAHRSRRVATGRSWSAPVSAGPRTRPGWYCGNAPRLGDERRTRAPGRGMTRSECVAGPREPRPAAVDPAAVIGLTNGNTRRADRAAAGGTSRVRWGEAAARRGRPTW